MKNKKIMVVCGGTSTEREVSLRSGKAVFEGLKRAGFSDLSLFDLKEDNMSEIVEAHPDCVFIALHGKGGEDGCIQGMLELAGIRYTGPDVSTSAICMNKIRTKQILKSSLIPTANFTFKRKDECEDIVALCDELTKKIGLPMVLKSPCQGSSIGVVMVKKKEEIPEAVKEIFIYGDELLAEEFLTGVELTLPIMGNSDLTILPDIEITSEREFYDYTAKYTSGLCHHIIPSRISDEERKAVVEIGERTYRELGCRGFSRIDFIIDKVKGPMVIEVNTVPGMTEMSLFPDSAKYAGISFEELVTRILSYAM
ncbi:MAG: D-alanine--D-alanine ligase [Ruminococcaceae bacterium]|nr:D-alanine--D-alanine ligase [Oscillospiraceae bacterium]